MIPARVIAVELKTGKIFQAMRSELVAGPAIWDWVEATYANDIPYIGGDVVLEFPTLADFPRSPPARSSVKDADVPPRK